MIRWPFIFIFSGFFFFSYSQVRQKTDSLQKLIDQPQKGPERRALIYKQLAVAASDSLLFKSLWTNYYQEAIKNNDPAMLSNIYQQEGLLYYRHFHYHRALKSFDSVVKYSILNGEKETIAAALMSRGGINYMLGKYNNSLNDYLGSEKVMKEINSVRLADLYGNIAMLYREMDQTDLAIKFIYKSIPIQKLTNDYESMVKALNNLGLIYKNKGLYARADSVYLECIAICKKNGIERDLLDVLYNRAVLKEQIKEFSEARKIYEQILTLTEKSDDLNSLKGLYANLAMMYLHENNFSASRKYMIRAEALAFNEDVTMEVKSDYYNNASQIYYELKDYKRSSENYYSLLKILEESEKSNEVMNFQKMQYSMERSRDSLKYAQEKEIEKIFNEKENEKNQNKLRIQKLIILSSVAGLLMAGLLLFFVYRAYKTKAAANRKISEQKRLLVHKNKEITDSITYAQRIQQSLLPKQETLNALMPEHFLIYKPRDIVSGDFYWTHKINANEFLLAVADCTGHGVPGAIMSVIGIEKLNDAIKETVSPSRILSLLNVNVKKVLQKDDEKGPLDGMDIALCRIDAAKRKIIYSGANRALWLWNRNNEFKEYKATKAGIAGYTSDNQGFTETEIALSENDFILLSTDGFADQFGGSRSKKVTTKQFKDWITKSDLTNISRVKHDISHNWDVWKNNSEQVDDVCVIGYKFV